MKETLRLVTVKSAAQRQRGAVAGPGDTEGQSLGSVAALGSYSLSGPRDPHHPGCLYTCLGPGEPCLAPTLARECLSAQ